MSWIPACAGVTVFGLENSFNDVRQAPLERGNIVMIKSCNCNEFAI
jgi:hypothetical protein